MASWYTISGQTTRTSDINIDGKEYVGALFGMFEGLNVTINET